VQIIKGSEPIRVEHPVFMIIGQPGICKTSLGFSMRDPLTLDFDLGIHRAVNRRDSLPVPDWKVVEQLLADRAFLTPYRSLVVDTAGRCLDVLTADIAATDPKKAPGGNLSQQGWGVLKTRFRQFVATVRALDKDLLILAHDKEDKDGDVRCVRADIVGGSYGEVMKNADFVGYLYMVGKDRILDFNPTDRWNGKNPAGWSAFKVPPADQATQFMAKLYDMGREALGTISESSAILTREVEKWRAWIVEHVTTVDECTQAVVDINKADLAPIVSSQVKKILLEHAESIGITFDKKRKTFVEREPRRKPPVKDQEPVGAGVGATRSNGGQPDPELGF
jgi:hypothetical protein